jgi:predicted TIM-barrel fold metal-dependent hydrolase
VSARRPRLAAPAGACDTHIHIYDRSVPNAPGGPPIPGHFPVAAYRETQARLGLGRVIVVQPNGYQDDNRVTLDAATRRSRAKVEVFKDGGELAVVGEHVMKWLPEGQDGERVKEGA